MPLNEDTLDQARHYLARKIAEGFDARNVIVQNAVEYIGDELNENECAELEAAMPRLYEQTLAAHRSAVAQWPGPTDCDRLDAAFDELNKQGIAARHNWTCCQTCGHAEMAYEVEQVLEQSPDKRVRGYTFYHQQDTESAAEGGGLYLAYGATEPGKEEQLSIGHEVVLTLRQHGLQPVWDGTSSTRISVPMNWQRRSAPQRWASGGYSGTPAKYRDSHDVRPVPVKQQPKSLLDRVKQLFGRS